jgi:DNA-binding Lrp family transcriptional regulator
MSSAFVFLNSNIGDEKAIIDELLTTNGVSYAYRTSGVYDIILKLDLDSDEDLRSTIVKIRRIDAVRSSLTLVVTER